MSLNISVNEGELKKMADTIRAEAALSFATQAQVSMLQSSINSLMQRIDHVEAAIHARKDKEHEGD